jgi:hypothetical protein
MQCATLRAQRERRDTRAGHYERKLQTKADDGCCDWRGAVVVVAAAGA